MIGIDIVEIKRFLKLGRDDHKLWNRTFTEQEWDYAWSRPDPSASLAGIFAAKEAVMKASRSTIEGLGDIEIWHSNTGAPYAKVGISEMKISLSVSHDGGVAVAVALINRCAIWKNC